MVKLLLGLLLALALTTPAYGVDKTGTITAAEGTVFLSSNDTGNGSFQVTGTWTGTLAFEVSNDGSTWVALNATPPNSTTAVTTTTANGVWTFSGAFKVVRVRASAWTSGTATVTVLATWARAGGGTSGGTTVASHSNDCMVLAPTSSSLACSSWKESSNLLTSTTATGFGLGTATPLVNQSVTVFNAGMQVTGGANVGYLAVGTNTANYFAVDSDAAANARIIGLRSTNGTGEIIRYNDAWNTPVAYFSANLATDVVTLGSASVAGVVINSGTGGITLTGDLVNSLLAIAGNSVDLGASTRTWRNVFVGTKIGIGTADDTFLTRTAAGVVAAGGTDAHPIIVGLSGYKTADESITNSTTLQADDHLTVSLKASTTYFCKAWIFHTSASATAGFKYGPAGTATVTALKMQQYIYDDTTNAIAALARTTSLGSSIGAGLGAGDNFAVMEGTIEVNAAGTFRIDWAQNTADAVNAVTVQRNSSLTCVKTN